MRQDRFYMNGQMSPLMFQYLGANTPPNTTNDMIGLALLKQAMDAAKQEDDQQALKEAAIDADLMRYGGTENRRKQLNESATTAELTNQGLSQDLQNRQQQRDTRSSLLDLFRAGSSNQQTSQQGGSLGDLVTQDLKTRQNQAGRAPNRDAQLANPNLQALLERLAPNSGVTLRDLGQNEVFGGYAGANPQTKSIGISEAVKKAGPTEQLFTLAHELGHIFNKDTAANPKAPSKDLGNYKQSMPGKLHNQITETTANMKAVEIMLRAGYSPEQIQEVITHYKKTRPQATAYGHESGDYDGQVMEAFLRSTKRSGV